MALPEWVLPFKEPLTEIRFIKGHYYKYQVEYKYNSEKKRTDKKTVRILGKITENEGFIPSSKETLRAQIALIPKVDIKSFGVNSLFNNLLKEEITELQERFKPEILERLLVFAQMRWASQAPIKRVPTYHMQDFSSETWCKNGISDKQITETLKFVGQNREVIVDWQREMLKQISASDSRFLMMDSTHVSTVSEKLEINAKGYNPDHSYDEQIRLMYLFSAQLNKPIYYRLINGNIPDVSSMALSIKEIGVSNVVVVADRGFFSKANIDELEKQNLSYIIPLRRNNSLIDFEPIGKANSKSVIANYFIYQERAIWFYQYEREGFQLITFLDDRLRSQEELEYLKKITSHPEDYTKEKFFEKSPRFGTMTVAYKLNHLSEPSAQQVYEAYKQRGDIETMFDSYKNYLKADIMYMQDRLVLEGWLFANFIAMIAYYKLYSRLKQAKLLGKHSPKDIIEISKAIYKLKIQGSWHLAEISSKHRKLLIDVGVDYLN